MLSGYKTYAVVALYVACILAEKVLGVDVPGFEAGPDWLNDLLMAAGVGTMRAGIATSASRAVARALGLDK